MATPSSVPPFLSSLPFSLQEVSLCCVFPSALLFSAWWQIASCSWDHSLSPLVCQQQEWTENISVRCYKMQSVSGSHQLHDTPSKNLMQEPRLPIFLYNFKYNPKDKFIASEKQAEGSSWWRETVNASYFHYHAHCALAFGGILKHGFLGFYCLYVLAQCYFSVYFNEWIYYIAHCTKFSVTLLKTL